MTVPDVLIERYLLGEVSDEERRLVEADPTARSRVDRLREQDEAILRTFDAGAVAREARARRTARRRRGWAAGAAALAAAASLAFLFTPTADHVRARGGEPELLLYRRSDGPPVRLASGDAASAGDTVQLAIVRGEDPHGVVVSIDGAGVVTLHFPTDGDTELTDDTIVLRHAYQLDDAPSFERFFLVTSDSPVEVDAILHAARALSGTERARTAALEVPEGVRQRALLLVKP